jgi:hypothetical protein
MLSPSGSGPSRREKFGFAATPDGMLYVFGGYDNTGTEGGSVGVALDAVMRRARAAPLLLLLSLADGMRVRREETAACQWATNLPLHRRQAIYWYSLEKRD